MTPNIAAARDALSHLDLDASPAAIRSKSRDFFWYSPVLKRRMDHLQADFVVNPRSEAEVIEVLRACYANDVPVTTRGAGTGNYGQAMPLAGGCVLHLRQMDQIVEVAPGRAVAEPGIVIRDLNRELQDHSGQEVRMMPSTYATATLGGFIAGGSGGIGSVHWGALRDLGNIIRLRVVTMEQEPRVLEFRGDEVPRVSHAYGTNGIITEIEIPLAPAYDWVEMFVGFDDFMECARFAMALGSEDGILTRLISPIEAPIPHAYFQRVAPYLEAGTSLVALMVAPQSLDAFHTFAARNGAPRIVYRSDDNDWPRGPGPVGEYTWNHTTLRALKVRPSVTYLQVRYGPGDEGLARVRRMQEIFGAEVLNHLEVLREGGRPVFSGLPIVEFTTEERLDEIVRIHEAEGCLIFNPHRYTLEEGGRQTVDDRQLAFKREADPKGLLNPGKMIAWDDPDWAFEGMYHYAGMRPAPAAAE